MKSAQASNLNPTPFESPQAERNAQVNDFFDSSHDASWRISQSKHPSKLAQKFLQTPQAYSLTTDHWLKLISELGSWANLVEFSSHRAALTRALALSFQQNQDHLERLAKHYIQSLSRALPNSTRLARENLLILTEDLFGVGQPAMIPIQDAQTHINIRSMLSRSALGIQLATHQAGRFDQSASLEWLAIDASVLIKNLYKLPPLEELPDSLLSKLQAEIARLAANSDGSEFWWQAVVNSYLFTTPLLPRTTLLTHLLENSSRSEKLFFGLLEHSHGFSYNEKLRLAPQWHQLLSEINRWPAPVSSTILLGIFEYLHNSVQTETLWPTTCANHKSILKDFFKSRIAPTLLQISDLANLPPEIFNPFSALLTNTLTPSHAQQIEKANFLEPDKSDYKALKDLLRMAEDFKKTYLTMLYSGQKKHLQDLPSYKNLPRDSRSELLKSLFEQMAVARSQDNLTLLQLDAFLKLLWEWCEADLSINAQAACVIAMHIDLTINPKTKTVEERILRFWNEILLPAFIGDPSCKPEDLWAVVLRRSVFASYPIEKQQRFAQVLAKAHQVN